MITNEKFDEYENQHDFYFDFVDIWKKFCETHSQLFNLTCDEYSSLLSNKIEDLENIVVLKENVLKEIKNIELIRQDFLLKLNSKKNNIINIQSVSELIDFFQDHPLEQDEKILYKYNLLLVDIIERIKVQNKKNQLFLNRSIMTLKEINDGIRGNKTFKTYNAHGISSSHKAD